MKCDVKKDGDCRVKLSITIDADEAKPYYEKVVAGVMREVKIPGFREGKVPRKMVEEKFSADINRLTRRDLIGAFTPKAAEEKELKIVELVDVESDIFSPETGMTFTAVIDLMPEFKLPKYASLNVKRNAVAIDEAQIDEQIMAFRRHLGAFEDVTGDTALTGEDLVQIDYKGKVSGVDAESLGDDRVLLEGADHWMHMGYGELVPGISKDLIGMRIGDTQKCKVELPKDFRVAALAGKKVAYEVTVKGIRARQPAEMDEVLKRTQAESAEKLKENVRKNMEDHARHEEEERLRREVIDALLNKADFALPRGKATEFYNQELEQIAGSYQNLSKDELAAKRDEIIKRAKDSADQRLRLRYILLAIAKEEKLTAEKEDLAARIQAIAQMSNQKPEKIVEQVRRNNNWGMLEEDVLAGKALQKLVDAIN